MGVNQEPVAEKMALKILLVEDDETTVESIKLGLEIFRPGTLVTAVNKGIDAITSLKDSVYDVVFLDLGLPDIDGVDVLTQIRGFSDINIIVVSARTDPTVVENALKKGANDFIIKPFDYHLLLNGLENIARKKLSPAK